jgi:sulfoxide reductase heme-binding subunit YedZ
MDTAKERTRAHWLAGWRLFGFATLVVALMCVALLFLYGTGESGLRSVVRGTARTSALLFTLAFVSRPLRTLRRTRASLWLTRHEPFVFASFAASHVFHAAALFALAFVTGGDSLEGRGSTLIFGGLAYAFTFAIAASSFGSRAAWVESHAGARVLRAVGLYLIWSIFMLSFTGRAVQSGVYVPVAVVFLAALALRIVAAIARRVRASAQVSAEQAMV